MCPLAVPCPPAAGPRAQRPGPAAAAIPQARRAGRHPVWRSVANCRHPQSGPARWRPRVADGRRRPT